MILKVNKTTPTCMVLGDLGRIKIEHNIDIRMLNYWFRNACNNSLKLSNVFYRLLLNLSISGVYDASWIKSIKDRLMKFNLYEYWERQNSLSINEYNVFKKKCKQNIQEFYKNEWINNVNESSKCYLYKGFKTELKIEKYITKFPDNLRIIMSKFRMCNHKLPVELGRHNNIDRKFRFCTKCNTRDIGDEFHYMFLCTFFSQEREKLLPKNSYRKPSVKNFCDVMSTDSNKTLLKVARFCRIIMSNFKL